MVFTEGVGRLLFCGPTRPAEWYEELREPWPVTSDAANT